MVAAATSNLCEAANASVQGHASEEKLISSAKQVAASTAQLLVACKVKADQDSEAMRRLQVRDHPTPEHLEFFLSGICEDDPLTKPAVFFCQIAGNAVKKASDNLVRAAQNAAFNKADDDNIVVKTKFVGGIAQVKSPSGNLLSNKNQVIRRNSHRKFSIFPNRLSMKSVLGIIFMCLILNE